MFNSLKYTKVLEAEGIPRNQAEAQIQIMTEIVETTLATKQDIKDLAIATKQDFKDFSFATKQDIDALRLEIKGEMKDLRTETRELRVEFKSDMAQLEYRIVVKLGTIVSVVVGIALAVATLLIKIKF